MAKKRKIHQNKTGNENNFWHQSRNVYGVGPVLAKDIRDLGLTLKVMKTLQTHTGYEIDCYCRLILLRSMYDFFNWLIVILFFHFVAKVYKEKIFTVELLVLYRTTPCLLQIFDAYVYCDILKKKSLISNSHWYSQW